LREREKGKEGRRVETLEGPKKSLPLPALSMELNLQPKLSYDPIKWYT